MRKKKRPSKELIKLYAFKVEDGHWRYSFDYHFVHYSASRGYPTREEAEKAGRKHIGKV